MRFALCLGLCAAIWAQTPAPKTSAPARRAASSRDANQDKEIEAAIQARFAASKIAADHFTVHVQGGVATIEGATDVVQRKGAATRLAKSAGAARVVNKIVVSEAGRARAAGKLEAARRVKVKRGEARSERR